MSIIEYTQLNFHNTNIPQPIKIFTNEDEDYNFGILNIKIHSNIPINTKHIHMFFTIDTSSSMNETCSDGKTKIKHIYHTLQNILKILYENKECNISIHVQSFDTNTKTIISNIPNIHHTNIEDIIQLIHQNEIPIGSTNIESALTKAKEEIYNYNNLYPEHEIIHLFLTDGDITSGSRDLNYLLELVPTKCKNIFIGYGLQHNSELLSYLTKYKYNEYRFIDALEKAGIVYGEIIHNILYKAIEYVTLSGINLELYNYDTNSWSSILELENLSSEQIKTIHVRTKDINNCNILLNGNLIIEKRVYQINIYPNFTEMNDLSIYVFRQKTQEFLYNSRKISEQHRKLYVHDYIRELEDYNIIRNEMRLLEKQELEFKNELKEFHKIMINYMKNGNVENDPIMKMLCDDIYIAYKTIGTILGLMYICARQTSNGQQQSYMCSAITQDIYNNENPRRRMPMPLERNCRIIITGSNEITQTQQIDYNNDIDNYTPTQDFLSPFLSEGVMTCMREVSGMYSLSNP
jgi:hypothetical protein